MELGAQKLFRILLYYLKDEPTPGHSYFSSTSSFCLRYAIEGIWRKWSSLFVRRKEAVTLPEKDEADFGDFEQTRSQLPKFPNFMDFQQSYISMVNY